MADRIAESQVCSQAVTFDLMLEVTPLLVPVIVVEIHLIVSEMKSREIVFFSGITGR